MTVNHAGSGVLFSSKMQKKLENACEKLLNAVKQKYALC